MEFSPVPLDVVDAVWADCAPMLTRSMRYGVPLFSVDDIREQCVSQRCQLWIAYEGKILGAVVTTISEGALAKTCSVVSLGGRDLKKWIHLLDERLTNFARMNGCSSIEAITRRGFQRFVPDFKPEAILHVKRL